jgi:hypothetical protein
MQQSHYLRDMDDPHKKRLPKNRTMYLF